MILIVDSLTAVPHFCFTLVLVYAGHYLIANDYGSESSQFVVITAGLR
ncbi:hypothetical protein IYO2065_22170 [Lactiplantibacillus plantarum]|jgi:hypothetical protein|nr:hypothetical protein SN35N_2380 [Lactiplantibacillus plantarum]GEK62957.1 hypothetical protein LJA01_08600 [Lactobacillus japonicus]GEO52443.1 hypothetical protein LPL03_05390 [Lactiplantibacillus argentoratensis]BEI47713.1 hypothetical protein IYO2065_22170 [Lactiplantibacillus plantarum]BEI50784.1 hypothetical protein AWA2013_21900 [Lactiplantibacillus plantarum]